MSIANELSSDVAAAVLARKGEASSVESLELKDVVMRVHSTLRHLTTEARKESRRAKSAAIEASASRVASNRQ